MGGPRTAAPHHASGVQRPPRSPTGRYGGGIRGAGPAPLRDWRAAVPGRSRERLDEGGEAEKSPLVGKRTRRGESAPRAGRPAPPSGGHRFGKGPRPPQRGPVERSERAGEADRDKEGKGRREGKGRKRVAGNPESGAAGPSAERSEALLSGGRTVAPVTERRRAKPAGSAPTPSASTYR